MIAEITCDTLNEDPVSSAGPLSSTFLDTIGVSLFARVVMPRALAARLCLGAKFRSKSMHYTHPLSWILPRSCRAPCDTCLEAAEEAGVKIRMILCDNFPRIPCSSTMIFDAIDWGTTGEEAGNVTGISMDSSSSNREPTSVPLVCPSARFSAVVPITTSSSNSCVHTSTCRCQFCLRTYVCT